MPVETELQAPASIRAPRGNSVTCKGWQQEAAMRMLMNNLDPDVANPAHCRAERGVEASLPALDPIHE